MNLNDYFYKFNTDSFIIFISVYDDASGVWNNFKQKKGLGLKESIDFRDSYIAIVDKSNGYIYEQKSKEYINFDYSLPNADIVHLTSAGFGARPFKSDILLNDFNFSMGKRGCNIAIYDKERKCVVDYFNVDYYRDKGEVLFRREDEFNLKIEEIRRGQKLADKYCSYNNEVFYYILNQHMGDANRILKCLNIVKEYYGEDADRNHFSDETSKTKNVVIRFPKKKLIKKLIIITSFANSGVVKLYQYIDGAVILNKTELEEISAYAASACALHHNIVCDENMQRSVWGRSDIDEGSYARALILGIGEIEWNFCVPKNKNKAKPSISNETLNSVKKFIYENNIKPDKTVIIAPMAQSSTLLNRASWAKYVKILISKGYEVFTNTGKEESEIVGTKKLFLPVDEVAALAQMGVKIVGIQSGFTDIIADISPTALTVLFLVKEGIGQDKQFAFNRGVTQEGITKSKTGVTYIKTEKLGEEDYILNLLLENFN